MLLAASTEDPYALRTVQDLADEARATRTAAVAAPAHGTHLLDRDPDLAAALVDWLDGR